MERLYRSGYRYHKAGVTVSRLERRGEQQLPLFSAIPDLEQEQGEMENMDRRKREGESSSSGFVPSWEMRRKHLSPEWTTSWKDLPSAEVDEG